MNSEAFINGFVKKAADLGFDDKAISDLFKLAMSNHQIREFANIPKQADEKIDMLRNMITNADQYFQLENLVQK